MSIHTGKRLQSHVQTSTQEASIKYDLSSSWTRVMSIASSLLSLK
jgi:hypothetical protein